MTATTGPFAKLLAALKLEPVVTAGGTVGAAAAIITWVQTNQITTLKQALSVGAPIVIAFVIRVFVTPNAKVALTTTQAAAFSAAKDAAAAKVADQARFEAAVTAAVAAHLAGTPGVVATPITP